MNFYQTLRKQREAQNLSPEQAAERLHLSLMAYQDREDNRVDINVPERCGLLVGLGMSYDDSVQIAARPDMYSLGGPEMLERMEKEASDPFVREVQDAFILVDRDHSSHEYTVRKDSVQSAENILGWIDHLAEKSWVTREHLHLFVGLSSHHLGIKIHPL